MHNCGLSYGLMKQKDIQKKTQTPNLAPLNEYSQLLIYATGLQHTYLLH